MNENNNYKKNDNLNNFCFDLDNSIDKLKDRIKNLEKEKNGLLGRINLLEVENKKLVIKNKNLQSVMYKLRRKGFLFLNNRYNAFMHHLKKTHQNIFRNPILLNRDSPLKNLLNQPLLTIKEQEKECDLSYRLTGIDRQETYNYEPAKECIFNILHFTLPMIVGYTIRSHELLSSINYHGTKTYGVSRLGFPWDRKGIPVHNTSVKDRIDNVTYLRLPTEKFGLGQVSLNDYMREFVKELLGLAQIYKPSLIHSASNFIGGHVGIQTARILGIPCIYEVRGLWELSRIAEKPEWRFSEEYYTHVKMETQACHDADVVITITNALKKYLINERGIDGNKIKVIPNGVNTNRFIPLERNKCLENDLNLKGKTVIGYAGTLNKYEGLDLLLRACGRLLVQRDDFRIILIGDGRTYDQLRKQSEKGSLQGKVIFTGQVPYDQINQYYSLIDIAAFPRRSSQVCELVSPLKHLEAMAMKKVVIASNVEALKESIEDGKNGILHKKDNAVDLARVLKILLDNHGLRKKISEQGRNWVVQNRDWNKLSLKVIGIYNEIQQEQFNGSK